MIRVFSWSVLLAKPNGIQLLGWVTSQHTVISLLNPFAGMTTQPNLQVTDSHAPYGRTYTANGTSVYSEFGWIINGK